MTYGVLASRIGVDVWWDHKLHHYRPKKINLMKVPLMYRCPNCGKILVSSERRRWGYRHETSEMICNWWGGVCRDCYLDGFGKHGNFGAFLKAQIEKDEQKVKKNQGKIVLWINGEVRLVENVIEIDDFKIEEEM